MAYRITLIGKSPIRPFMMPPACKIYKATRAGLNRGLVSAVWRSFDSFVGKTNRKHSHRGRNDFEAFGLDLIHWIGLSMSPV